MDIVGRESEVHDAYAKHLLTHFIEEIDLNVREVGTPKSSLEDILEEFCDDMESPKLPLVLLGPHGSGKSAAVVSFHSSFL